MLIRVLLSLILKLAMLEYASGYDRFELYKSAKITFTMWDVIPIYPPFYPSEQGRKKETKRSFSQYLNPVFANHQ